MITYKDTLVAIGWFVAQVFLRTSPLILSNVHFVI